jgi:hypothetical protein
MRRTGALAAVAALMLVVGAGSVEAAKLTPPEFTQAEIKRAAAKALASGAKPRKLRGATPAWYGKKEKRRVERDKDGNGWTAAPVDAPLPGEVGIRPGSWMISPYLCTMNFIFQKSGTLAIGTAGHCIDGNEPVVLLTLAPSSGVPVLVELGQVLLKRNAGIGQDYALVEIPPEHHDWVFPTMGVVGGPCGVFAENTPQPVFHYGHGVGVGTGGTPRAGMGFALAEDPIGVKGTDWDWDADSIVWAGLINGGDSGSGVRVGTLPAVSNLTHGIGITGLEPSAIAWGTRVTTITSGGWQLVNSPLCV